MMMVPRCLVPAVAIVSLGLALAGCGKDKPPAVKGSADGEILEGSASDAMLPVDTVRSQAPLAPRSESTQAAGSPDHARTRPGDRNEARPEKQADPVSAPEAESAPEAVTPAAE